MFLFQVAMKPIDFTKINTNQTIDSIKEKIQLSEVRRALINATNNNQNLTVEEKKERVDAIKNVKNWDDLKRLLNNYNDLAREFANWVRQFEETRKALLGSKISKVKNPSPVKIADDVKKANRFMEDGERATTEVAKEYSPLKAKGKKEKGGENEQV